MTPEQQRGIVQFLRKYMTLICDFTVLHSLLDTFESDQKPPYGWQQLWHEMQKDPDYKASVALLELFVSAVEKAKTETEVIELLHKISDTRQPN